MGARGRPHAGRAAEVLRPRHRNRADAPSSLPPAAPPDRGVSDGALRADGTRPSRARSHDAVQARSALRPHASANSDGRRHASHHRQHGTLDRGRRRMGRGETWTTGQAGLEEASRGSRPIGSDCRPGPDRGDVRRCDNGHHVDRGGPRPRRPRHGGHGLRHDRLLRCGQCAGRDRRGSAGQDGKGVSTQTAVARA